jgi:type IV pilus assembly protein PilM
MIGKQATTFRPRKVTQACDLAADRIVAARIHEGLVDMTAVRTMGAGAITPNLTGQNIALRDVVRTGVQEAMAAIGARSRDVILIVPDAACRLVLLEFDSLPEKPEEAQAVVRFRLKKSLPFEVERARVSFQAYPPKDGKLSVLVAVILHQVLEEYEAVVRGAGYLPGAVLPAMIAALGQVDATIPTLVIKLDRATTSVAIVDSDRLALIRTLDNPAGTRPESQQLAEDIYPSLVFYQDTYGTKVEKILMHGAASLPELGQAIEEYTGVRVQELVRSERLSAAMTADRSALGSVVGALAQ